MQDRITPIAAALSSALILLAAARGRSVPFIDEPRNPSSPVYPDAVVIRETRTIDCCYPTEGERECAVWDTVYGTEDATEKVAAFYRSLGFEETGVHEEGQSLLRWIGVRKGDRVSWRKVDIATGQIAGAPRWTTGFELLAPNCTPRAEEETQAEPAPVAEPLCAAENLRVLPRWGAALGSYGGSWRFVNTGSSACRLLSRPRAELVDAEGRVLLRSAGPPSHPHVFLRPGDDAEAIVLWSNWCQSYQGPFRIRIILRENAGVLTTEVPGVAGCVGPAEAGSMLSVEGFFTRPR